MSCLAGADLRAVYISITAVNIMYGAWTLIAKTAMRDHGMDPLVFVIYRCLGGACLMFLAMQLVPSLSSVTGDAGHRARLRDIGSHPGELARLLLLGFLMAANVGGSIWAISNLSALTCSIFQPTVPLIACFAGAILKIEDFSWRKLTGILFSATGAMIVIVFGEQAHAGGAPDWRSYAIGVPCLFVNVCGSALYNVLQKPLLQVYPPIFVAAVAFLVAGCLFLLAGIHVIGSDLAIWSFGGDRFCWSILGYAALLNTAVSYTVNAWANKETTPSTVTGFMSIQPIAAAVLSWAILGVLLTPGQAVGGSGVIVGLLILARSQDPESSADKLQTPLVSAKQSV